MNTVILENNTENKNSSNHDSKSSSDIIITKSGPQPKNYNCCYSCCSSEGVFLVDNVTHSIMSADKWISQELDRLSHNYLPRNCTNYEALLTVVEGCYQTEPYNNIVAQKVCCFHSNTQYYGRKQPLLSQILCDSNTSQPTSTTTIGDDQLTKRNLIVAFANLMKYCQSNESFHQFYIEHHRKPLELLLEMEKVCQAWRREKIKSNVPTNFSSEMRHYQNNLGLILFGTNMAIAKDLVGAWTIVCLWVHQDTLSFAKLQKWSTFGIYSYELAKKLCGIEHQSR